MKLFNPLLTARILSTILLLESAAFLACLPVAYIYNEPVKPFYWSAGITFFISLVFSIISQNADRNKFSNRDGYLVVAFSWISFLLLGTLPFLIGGTLDNFADAFFESSSGFTTTGSSIFEDVESLPKSINFWRNLTHWIGGLGIIVLVIIILPSLGITGYQLFSLESSLREKIHPKTKAIGFRILIIYLGMTCSLILLLVLGKMPVFDSICTSFSTVATGGFALKNNSMAGYSPYIQYVLMIFMFLGGISYVVYYYLFKFNLHKVRQNEELLFYVVITLIAGAVVSSILLSRSSMPPGLAVREGFFNVVSVITTTGFVTTDVILWPVPALLLLFLLFFSGACTGSTSGSIKIARHVIVIKSIKAAFVKLIHPSAYPNIRYSGKLVSEKTSISIMSFVILYLFIFLIGSIVIVMTGQDLITSASAVAASLGNTGFGLGTVGPMSNYSHFSQAAKIVLSLLMTIGRVEIIAILTLFTRSFWKL